MKTKNIMPDDFVKKPSVCRSKGYFLYSANNRIWIVKNPLNDCWFFEKETCVDFKCKSIVSRVYFRSSKIAKDWFLEGNEVIW